MMKIGIALGILLAVPGLAHAQRTSDRSGRAAFRAADPTHRRTVRLNRAVFGLVGQQASVPRVCGADGARQVRVKSNGWDALFSFVTVGMYTPQHAYVVCNAPTIG